MNRSTFLSFTILLLMLGGCTSGTPPVPSQVNTTISSTPTSVQISTQKAGVETPEAVPTSKPRTLVICLGSQPETLYPYGGQMLAMQSVLAAVYDGPIDSNSFGYQPVILEKLPDIADGDAVIEAVSVEDGELVVDNEGELNFLSAGDVIRPAGCQSPECAVIHPGGEVDMDQMVVTFTLLENLKWSDGEPLTAHDSVYSYNLDANSQTPTNKFVVERTASYKALDDRTTRWVSLPGFLDQTYFLNFWTPFPQHVWGQYTASELLEVSESAEIPMGWGPYMIEEWKEGKQIVMVRNPNYFRADEGLPKFDKLIYRFIGKESETNLSALLAGECDVLDQDASYFLNESETFTTLQAGQKLNAYFVPGALWEHLDFSLQPSENWQGFSATSAFQDVQLRQAISSCLDRQRIVDEVFSGQSFVPDSYLSPFHPLFRENLPSYPFDIQAGSALLDEIGWLDEDDNPSTPRRYQGDNEQIPQGTILEFNYWASTYAERTIVIQILAESLAQCGIKANIQLWSPEELFKEGPDGPLGSRQFDVVQFAFLPPNEQPPCNLWLTTNIPGNPDVLDDNDNPLYPMGWSGTNVSGYSNPEYDQVCKMALSLLPGQSGYMEAHLKAQEIFARDLPVIPLYMRLKLAVTRPDMCGFIMDSTADSEMWNIEEFNYGPGCQ